MPGIKSNNITDMTIPSLPNILIRGNIKAYSLHLSILYSANNPPNFRILKLKIYAVFP